MWGWGLHDYQDFLLRKPKEKGGRSHSGVSTGGQRENRHQRGGDGKKDRVSSASRTLRRLPAIIQGVTPGKGRGKKVAGRSSRGSLYQIIYRRRREKSRVPDRGVGKPVTVRFEKISREREKESVRTRGELARELLGRTGKGAGRIKELRAWTGPIRSAKLSLIRGDLGRGEGVRFQKARREQEKVSGE